MTATTRPALQRASGESRVAFALKDGATRLADLYQRDPCRVMFPEPEPGEPPQAVLLTTSGGVTDGDSLKMAIDIGPGARAVAATQAAEKIYRAAKGGALLACEMVVLGRAASGERFTGGLLLDSWSVRRAGRLVWTDTLRVEGETPVGAGFGAANALATVIGVWDEPLERFEKARALLEPASEVRTGVTLVNGVMVARLLGEATKVRAAAVGFLTAFRGRRLPRVWHV